MPGVRGHVLGTAQDGGVPHPGCACPRCGAARADPARRRRVASVAVEGATGKTFLVDATPDFREQTDALAAATGRPPPAVDAIAVSHAHVGHYLGLAFLGKEAMHARGLPVHGTASVERFLRENRPWSHLVERGEIDLRTLEPGRPLAFDGATIRPFLSPHRGEDTDTLGFEVEGPSRRLLYLSDADVFSPDVLARVRSADVALVDGTFFGPGELPRRDMGAVPHPFVSDSVRILEGARGTVHFTHLNHTNPLLDPESPEARALPAGFRVLAEGSSFDL